MSGTSDPSNHEMLDRLTAELRCLRPDVREPEFKNWRTEVTAAMSELFGPGHRMTVALRDVNFSPRFEQGRTRAMALLRAASSLVTSAPSESPAAAAPEPAPELSAPPPDLITQPTVATDDEPTPVTVLDQTSETNPEPPVVAEPVADPMPGSPVVAEPVADPMAAAELVRVEPVDEEPVDEEPAGEEPAAPLHWPYLTDWPAPATEAAEPPNAELSNADPGAEAPEPESIAAATEMPDDDADRPLSTAEEDAFTLLMLAAEARPKLAATPEADEAVEPPLAASEPEIAASEPKRGTFLRKIARKRGRSRALPALPGEPPAEPAAEPAPALVAGWMDDAESAIPVAEVFVTPWSDAIGSLEAAVAVEPEPAPGPDLIEEPAVSEPEVFAEVAAEFDVEPDDFAEPDASDLVPVAPRAKAASRQRARRRSKHRLRRLRVPIVALLFGSAVGVWLWLFGGWSMMYGVGESFRSDSTMTLPAAAVPNPSVKARVVDAIDDPRSEYIIQVVRTGIVQLSVTAAGEASFLPAKVVGRGELLVWLDRVQRIPVGSRDVPDTLYYDLDRRLRILAVDAYQQRIVLDWPGENTKIPFNAGKPIVARDAEAWAARLVLRLLPSATLASALAITEAQAVDLRARISSLKTQELTRIVQGFALRPETGWATEQSITRSEAAEFLMRLKTAFEKYPPVATR